MFWKRKPLSEFEKALLKAEDFFKRAEKDGIVRPSFYMYGAEVLPEKWLSERARKFYEELLENAKKLRLKEAEDKFNEILKDFKES